MVLENRVLSKIFRSHWQAEEICFNDQLSNFISSFPCGAATNVGHGLLILEVSRSHTMTRTTVGRTPLGD